jgi:SSS family solute:Na+ symporter
MDDLLAGRIGNITTLDTLVVIAAVALLFVIAYFAGKKETSTKDYFLGSRKIPAFVVCLSFVATEVSAVTIVGVPANAFSDDWSYLQFFVGSAAARILVAFLFIPVFFKYNCTTIYEYLRYRFNASTQYTGSIFFFITRLVASGFRLYLACMAVGIILGWPLLNTLILFSIVSIVFIAFGGIKAVVWNGAYQAVMFYVAGGALLVYLVSQIPGGFAGLSAMPALAQKTRVFNFSWGFNEATSFYAGMANAFFLGLVVFGTDQELVQRLLTVNTRRASQKAIIATIAAALPLLLLYLGIGTLLYAFYHFHPDIAAPGKAKEVFSFFASNSLPAGLKGLVLAVVILASIDSPLSSLSSSFVTDIYRPLVNRNASEGHYLWVSRFGVIGFGLVLGVIAWFCQNVQDVLWFAFEIFSITGGSTLGIFLFGMITRRKSTGWGNVLAMIATSLTILCLMLFSHKGLFGERIIIPLGWTWLIVIGTFMSLGLAYLMSARPLEPQQSTSPST